MKHTSPNPRTKSNFSLKCPGKFYPAFGELSISAHLLQSVFAAVDLRSLLALALRHSTAETALAYGRTGKEKEKL